MNKIWPISIIFVIALFIGLTISFVIMAFSHRVDLVTKDYYEKDLMYNERQKRESAALSLEKPFLYSAKNGTIYFTLPNVMGSPCHGTITFYSPLNPAMDKSVKFQEMCGYPVKIETPFLTRGFWRLKFEWASGDKKYFREVSLSYEG